MLPIPSHFKSDSPYRQLAKALDALPNRFPPAEDEAELRLLAKIFEPAEAELASQLLPEFETPVQISQRLGRDAREIANLLKDMTRKGQIALGKTSQGRLGFSILPFIVGIYEAQAGRIDAEMARLFEDYFHKAYSKTLEIKPQVHRVIPIGASINNPMEVLPYESTSTLVDQAQAWGVTDCICRVQKALIGEPCNHPVDVCMILSNQPDAFSNHPTIRAQTLDEAKNTLKRAAEAGLVHSVSNNQSDLWYICNCCTCSCGILRGMAEMGISNVIARSGFINRVNQTLCTACGLCEAACPFHAITVDETSVVAEIRCVGCGVCVTVCPQGALGLERRVDAVQPPVTDEDWRLARMSNR
jgi:Na+-translocating ferredoxin:NAD+ oxidoreductase subunit B